MSKYNEIMEHIKADEEMRLRILDGVDRALAGDDPSGRGTESEAEKTERMLRAKSWRRLIPVGAAACLILAAGTVLFQSGLFRAKGSSAPAVYQADATAETPAEEEAVEYAVTEEAAAAAEEADEAEAEYSPDAEEAVPETAGGETEKMFSLTAEQETEEAADLWTSDAEEKAAGESTAEEDAKTWEDSGTAEDTGNGAAAETVILGTLEELQAAVSFPVRFPAWLPESVGTYRAEYRKEGNAARIDLYGESGMTLTFRTCLWDDPAAAVSSAAEETLRIPAEEVEREGVEGLVLTGDGTGWKIASWREKDGGQKLGCSVFCESGLTAEEFVKIVSGMGQET